MPNVSHSSAEPIERLSAQERQRLKRLELVVERGLEQFLEVGRALQEIRASRLWREEFPNYRAYLSGRWGAIAVRTAYAYEEASRVWETVHSHAQIEKLSVLRLLAPLPEAERIELAPSLEEATLREARAIVREFRQAPERRRPALPVSEPSAGRGRLRILVGDALEQLRLLEPDSVACCVTSPPFFGKRDFGDPGQIGLEDTVEEYVAKLVSVFGEVRRVLRPDGVLWLNLADSYGSRSTSPRRQIPHGDGRRTSPYSGQRVPVPTTAVPYRRNSSRDAKQLLGVPWRVALALQSAGWILRGEQIWEKPDSQPESVRDRPTLAHEHVFLLAKNRRYYYDASAVAEPTADGAGVRNRRSVWRIPTGGGYPGQHYATMPPQLAEICIRASTPATPDHVDAEPAVVLDPFAGVGTTAVAALQLGRSAVCIELNETYASEIETRVRELGLGAALDHSSSPVSYTRAASLSG